MFQLREDGSINITAKVITDSAFMFQGKQERITTLQLRYPRIVHSELMTHRVFTRNASSSRAVPIEKMIEQVRNDPACPAVWTKNQPGMQGIKITNPIEIHAAQQRWLASANRAAADAEEMNSLGLHKQIVNRVLEPYSWISVVLTATTFDNWFELRNHGDADPTINLLARRMLSEMDNSTPAELKWHQWHIPYLTDEERESLEKDDDLLPIALKVSAARCARVSYLLHDGTKPNMEKDLALYDRLIESKPMHASPIEHQARRASYIEFEQGGLHGNFNKPFVQYRKLIESNLPLF